MRRALAAVALALTVVLAGCAGAGGPTTTAPTTQDTTQSQGTTTTATGDAARLAFYVSDRPGAIEDFRHLNVTITRIGLHYTGTANASTSTTSTTTVAANETTTTTAGTTSGTTATTTNETTTTTTTQPTTNETTTITRTTTESASGSASDANGYWVERDIDDTTVDLTELQGQNASLLGNLSVPAGTYDKVFAYVSSVNGTLTSGETVNVKLPSQKLHVNAEFTLNATESAHFVYDVNVVKAGKSGKYILKPVVSETGIGMPVNPVNHRQIRSDCDCGERGGLNASIVGNVTAGENVTVEVTENGSAVANATVVVNDRTVGETGANGTVTFTVPDAKKVTVVVTKGDLREKLTVKFGTQGRHGGDGGGERGERGGR